jgi:hypothetical protein
MELEDFETIHLARELAREKGWDHVIAAIRTALRREYDALALAGRDEAPSTAG